MNLFNQKLNIIYCVTYLLCCPFLFYSQVLSIDRENGQDSVKKKFRASILTSFSSDKQKNNFIEFANTTELDYFLKNNYLYVLLSQSDLAFNGLKAIQNNGFIQLRYRDNDSRKIAPDVFTQYQWNGIQGLEYRSLIGINARYKWLEKRKGDLYTSLGIFYEIEKWNTEFSAYSFRNDTVAIVIYREMFRLNTVVKFAFKLASKVDFACTSYVQFPINSHFLQPRWFFDSNLFFEISKNLNFIIHYNHNYDTYRALPIDNYYYSVSLGVQIKI